MGTKRNRIALALGGGGARGLAHIGVLRAFERASVPIDLLVGTSIGALVGGAFAAGLSADEMEKRVDAYLESSGFQSSALKALGDARGSVDLHLSERIQTFLKNRYYALQAMFKPGILSKENFQSTINFFIPDILIEETGIPFRAVATDLVSGEQITFADGPLRQAVTASCAVPGAVEPLKDGEMILLDGGVICLIPASVARKEGADVVIAVAVVKDVCSGKDFHNTLNVYSRIGDIMANRLKDYELMDADIIIRPEVGQLHWSEFSRAKHLIEAGEKATMEKLKEIQRAIPGRKKWFTLRQLLRR
jgi:NTE family protein